MDFNEQLKEYYKKIGAKGGKTGSSNMTPEARKERAKKAVEARWAKKKKD